MPYQSPFPSPQHFCSFIINWGQFCKSYKGKLLGKNSGVLTWHLLTSFVSSSLKSFKGIAMFWPNRWGCCPSHMGFSSSSVAPFLTQLPLVLLGRQYPNLHPLGRSEQSTWILASTWPSCGHCSHWEGWISGWKMSLFWLSLSVILSSEYRSILLKSNLWTIS